jgi:long-subunit fatty acid transport protein
MAMGGVFSAVADDANAAYWNVAGLAQLEQTSVVVTVQVVGPDAHGSPSIFSQYGSPNAYFESVNFGMPVSKKLGVGISAEWSGHGSYMLNPGLGYKVTDNIMLGLRLSVWNFGEYPIATGVDITGQPVYTKQSGRTRTDLDLDALWNIDEKWSAGVHIESFWTLANDLGPTGLLESPNVRPAVAYRLDDQWLFVGGIYDLLGRSTRYVSLGCEYTTSNEKWQMRAGIYNYDSEGKGMLTGGFGYHYSDDLELGYNLGIWAANARPELWNHNLGMSYSF